MYQILAFVFNQARDGCYERNLSNGKSHKGVRWMNKDKPKVENLRKRKQQTHLLYLDTDHHSKINQNVDNNASVSLDLNQLVDLNQIIFRIDFDIDFNQRPKDVDPTQAMERLERIEKETMERLKQGNSTDGSSSSGTNSGPNATVARCAMTIMSDFEMWKDMQAMPLTEPVTDVESLFNDINIIRPITSRFMGNAESPQE